MFCDLLKVVQLNICLFWIANQDRTIQFWLIPVSFEYRSPWSVEYATYFEIFTLLITQAVRSQF